MARPRTFERVGVVPNPYRGGEVWDPSSSNEIHFINLPSVATIKIYTVAGDLVREIHHSDSIHDFERWDLRSGANQQVASGIYIYRVESNVAGQGLLVPESPRHHRRAFRKAQGPPTGGP